MIFNRLKNIIQFSCVSVVNKRLIETMSDDESFCKGMKTSAILESRLIDSFLTENNQIKFWIIYLYSGDTSSGDTSGEILSSVFGYNSSWINWKSQGLPVLPFIEFAINEQKYIGKYKVDKLLMGDLWHSLSSIRLILEKLKSDNFDIESSLKFAGALETLNYFMDQLSGKYGDEKIQFGLIYHFFKDYWDDLKDSTHTFRALSDLAEMQKGWRNSKESRYLLTCCLRQLEEYMSE